MFDDSRFVTDRLIWLATSHDARLQSQLTHFGGTKVLFLAMAHFRDLGMPLATPTSTAKVAIIVARLN